MAPMAQRSCGSRGASATPGGIRVRPSGTGRSEKLAGARRPLWRDLVRTDSLDELQVSEGDRLDRFPLVFRARAGWTVRPRSVIDRDGVDGSEPRGPTRSHMDLRPTDISDEIGVHPHATAYRYSLLARRAYVQAPAVQVSGR